MQAPSSFLKKEAKEQTPNLRAFIFSQVEVVDDVDDASC